MLPTSLLLAALLARECSGQQAFFQSHTTGNDNDSHDRYEFKWPIKKVAIIGAGVGGLVAYRELKSTGKFESLRIFERDTVPGGNWHYTEEQPKNPPVPNGDAAIADYDPSLPPSGVSLPYEETYSHPNGTDDLWFRRRIQDHRNPKPLWASLHSNAPSAHQEIREIPWPVGTPWELPHATLTRYLRSFASWRGVNTNDNSPDISYNTRVEVVKKRYDTQGRRVGWRLTLKKFDQVSSHTCKATWWTEDFDAVVVATGRYNAPNIPGISGLDEWAERFPDQVQHSRQYRRPEHFANQTVLVIGAGTSGSEISRDLNAHVKHVYQSVRPDNSNETHYPTDRHLIRIPANTTVVGEIKRLHPLGPNTSFDKGKVELSNGTVITGIDAIISATGFRYSFPFLKQYHSHKGQTKDGPAPLVTDGSHIRSLYLDVFYIEEPTIAFINMNIGMQSFSYSEFTAAAAAKVWARQAYLPSTAEQWRRHKATVSERGGYSKYYLFLGGERTRAITRFFVSWLNDGAEKFGGRQLDTLNDHDEILSVWAKARFGTDVFNLDNSTDPAFAPGLDNIEAQVKNQKRREADLAYDAIYGTEW